MDHAEFRETRTRLGLSQAALAQLLGLDTRTIERYETDPARGAQHRPPHAAACTALRWLAAGRVPKIKPAAASKPKRAGSTADAPAPQR